MAYTPIGPRALPALIKRSFDVVFASLALVCFFPLMFLVVLAIRLTGPGPALFHQSRVGYRGAHFRMFKFRTMDAGSGDGRHREYVTELLLGAEPKDGGVPLLYKLSDDPRITPIGSFLRRTSLDELPQLINVIRGEMSLVGPRPVLPWEAELFKPDQAIRFAVKPGITGLWQVRGRNALTMVQGLELDAEYVTRWSLHLDLGILARTVPTFLWAAFTGRGVR